jgi:hypothetical protein
MSEREDPKREGHTREWQDRARVVLDAKKAARTEASPNQSPVSDDETREKDEKKRKEPTEKKEKDDRFY